MANDSRTTKRSKGEDQIDVINLAEGYPYRTPTSTEADILASLQEIYAASLSADVQELEGQFVKDLLRLSGQAMPQDSKAFVLFSASEAISLIAKVLAHRGMGCAILEPTLYIIPALIKSAGVQVESYDEALLLDIDALLDQVDVDAIYTALPNNPTGFFLDQTSFELMARKCKEARKTLIIDASFRAFEPRSCFDYYEILNRTGVDYLVIEDTGKLWATNGLKAGVIVASEAYVSDVRVFFDDLLLTISPFILALLCRLVHQGGDTTIQEIRQCIKDNRGLISEMLKNSPTFHTVEGSMISMECIFYDKTIFTDQQKLLSDLQSLGVKVVGSESLCWANRDHEPFLRVALSRNIDDLRKGINALLRLKKNT